MSHDAHAATDGFPKPHYREYMAIFGLLTLLTIAELGVVYLEDHIGKVMVVSALCAMAIAKAALVGLFFMHLKHETKVLRWTVFGPLTIPFFYAVVLIAEAGWRLLHAAPSMTP